MKPAHITPKYQFLQTHNNNTQCPLKDGLIQPTNYNIIASFKKNNYNIIAQCP